MARSKTKALDRDGVARAGLMLLGPQWRSGMADLLTQVGHPITRRTIQRIEDGETLTRDPEKLRRMLRSMLLARAREIDKWLDRYG